MVGQAVAAITLLLLGASGVAKVLDPIPTSGALRAAGLPSARGVSLTLGLVEILAAVAGLALGSIAVAPAAVLYAAFTVFTLAAVRRRIPLQSCGCFGRDDTPPDVIHVVYNGVATVALTWVAASGSDAIPWDSAPVDLVLFVGFAVLGGYASYLLLAVLPITLKNMRAL